MSLESAVTVHSLCHEDVAGVCDLWDEHLPVAADETIVRKAAEDDDSWEGFVARKAGNVLAYAIQHYTDQPRELHDLPEDLLVSQVGTDAVWASSVTHPAFRSFGLGKRLGQRRLKAAARRDTVTRTVAVAWGDGNHLVKALDFEPVGEIEAYYDHDDSGVTVYRRWL